ncbi:hypothetical protein B0A52_05110 [Exophiala mesophila]|uniref:Uncharacterized protein n=1 Tax=Exophiala mesophila TaxID=212818 RepID=A0A438N6Z0_EXOME|nr:hypothetical protein B0A52_05110 [Exophiala mesophila]
MPSPHKKRPISEFFRPYNTSNVPAKRPSPSIDLPPGKKSPSKPQSPTRTPKPVKKHGDDLATTPRASFFSPAAAPGSTASLPYRSPVPKSSLKPPSIYKSGSLFGASPQADHAQNRQIHSFHFQDLPGPSESVVQRQGPIVIPDSDEDTDSLLSLADIFGKPQDETSRSSSPKVDEDKNELERKQLLSLFTRGRSDPLVGRDKLRELHRKQQAHKFDLHGILDDHFGDEDNDKTLKKAQDHYHESTRPKDHRYAAEMDRELLATVAHNGDDDDHVKRLMDAVQRTEALNTERVFSFFGNSGLSDWSNKVPDQMDFPHHAISNGLRSKHEEDALSTSFISGYLAELASTGKLAHDVLIWTFYAVATEPRVDLRYAYISCLSNGSSSWTRNNLKPSDVHDIFKTLGADSASLDDSDTIIPRHRLLKEPARRDPKYLLAVLDMFRGICQDMDFLVLSHLTSIICRLCLDQEMMSDMRISTGVEGLLEHLLSLPDPDMRSHVMERVLDDIGQHLKSPLLQAQLLDHILPTSSSTIKIRILLARTFLLGPLAITLSKLSPIDLSLDPLTEHITTSESFETSRSKTSDPVDYTALKALTHILDIAISDGGRPSTFETRADEVSFNRSVDHLADAVRTKYISIQDTGASHMSRTEAKDLLRSLHWRLLYSVRSEIRLKKGVFDGNAGKNGGFRDGDEVRSEERSRGFMKGFLEKVKAKGITNQGDDKVKIEALDTEAGSEPEGNTEDQTESDEERDADSDDPLHAEEDDVVNNHSVTSTATTTTLTSGSTTTTPSETEMEIRRQLGLT